MLPWSIFLLHDKTPGLLLTETITSVSQNGSITTRGIKSRLEFRDIRIFWESREPFYQFQKSAWLCSLEDRNYSEMLSSDFWVNLLNSSSRTELRHPDWKSHNTFLTEKEGWLQTGFLLLKKEGRVLFSISNRLCWEWVGLHVQKPRGTGAVGENTMEGNWDWKS